MDLYKISTSRLNTHKDCEFKYFLTYHLRFPESRDSNIYGIKGNAVHQALEYYARAKMKLEENASLNYEQILKDFYAETKLWKLDNGIRKGKGFTHPVDKYCETCPWATSNDMCSIAKIPFKDVEGCPRPNFEDDLYLTEKAVKYKKYDVFNRKILGAEVEYNINIPADESFDEDIKLKGVIDLVTEIDEYTIEITDHKSGHSTKGYDAARKDPQIRTYSMVARMLWPQYKYIASTLWYLRKSPITCFFDEEDDKKTLSAIRKHWKKIKYNNNPHRPKSKIWLCNYCIGYDRCGQIYDDHKSRGKIILPIVHCDYANQNKCWGPLLAEYPARVTASNTKDLTYACEGHFEIHQGGEYKEQEKNG